MEDIFTTFNLIVVVASYLIGSIPSSVWIGKWRYGIDVREHGSKNAGATNTFRVLGKKAGIPVLLFDIFKGWLPVFLFAYLSDYTPGTENYVQLQLACGMFAIIGHIFPLFAGFNGGKGVATTLGVILGVHLFAALLCLGVFLLIFLITRYVSLGTLSSAIAFPLLVILLFDAESEWLIAFSIGFSVLVIFTHQKNIERLVHNEENRFTFRKDG